MVRPIKSFSAADFSFNQVLCDIICNRDMGRAQNEVKYIISSFSAALLNAIDKQ